MKPRQVIAAATAVLGAAAFVTLVANDSGGTATFTPAQCVGAGKVGEGACGTQFRHAVEALTPGTTLLIAPGTYDIGNIVLYRIAGTANAPIQIKAQNPYRRPVLRGRVWFRSVSYLSILHLRFEARVPNDGAIDITCGVGWSIRGSEIYGADYTRAYYTLGIAGRQPGGPNPDDHGDVCLDEPRDFLISENVFSRPFTDPSLATSPDLDTRRRSQYYHHIYASFEGSTRTGGRIERNVFAGMKNGAGIKLGDSYFRTLGPWNVLVNHNTFVDGQRAMIIHDNARNNRVDANLFVGLHGAGGACGQGIGVVYNDSDPTVNDSAAIRTNIISRTYGYDITRVHGPSNDRALKITDGGDNGPLNAGTPLDCPQPGSRPLSPRLDAANRPQEPAAQPYGRYGTLN